jgi:hypothetical protein
MPFPTCVSETIMKKKYILKYTFIINLKYSGNESSFSTSILKLEKLEPFTFMMAYGIKKKTIKIARPIIIFRFACLILFK